MILLTQSVAESGITGVIPVGFVRVDNVYLFTISGHDYKDDTTAFLVAAKEKYPDVDYIFNVRTTIWLEGHPSNGYRHGRLDGDAYRKSTIPPVSDREGEDAFLREGLVAIAGAVCTPEAGYTKDARTAMRVWDDIR